MACTAKLIYSNLHGGQRPAGRANLIQIYHVDGFDATTDDLGTVMAATNLPQPGDSEVIGSPARELYVLDRVARSLDPVSLWEVTVTYCESPANIPVTVNRYATHKPYPVWGDTSNKLPRNAVGDPFLPPLQRTRALTRIEVSCRAAKGVMDTIDLADYVDHKSSSAVTFDWTDGDGALRTMAFDADTLYLDDVRLTTVQEPITHYQVTLLFLEDKKLSVLSGFVNGSTATSYSSGTQIGFKEEVPNAGGQFKDSGGKLVAFQDDNGVCVNGIGLLKADGTKCSGSDAAVGVLVDSIPNADLQALFNDVTTSW